MGLEEPAAAEARVVQVVRAEQRESAAMVWVEQEAQEVQAVPVVRAEQALQE